MSDGSISQDEIDALLAGVDMGGMGASSSTPSQTLTDSQAGALKGFLTANADAQKAAIEAMTSQTVEFGEPSVEVLKRDGLLHKLPEIVVGSVIDFTGGLAGDHLIVLAPEFAQEIVSLVNNEPNAEFDDMALSVISEMVSQYVGTEVTALDKAGFTGVTNNPAETVHVPKAMIRFPQNDFVAFSFQVTLAGTAYTWWEIIPYKMAVDIAAAFGATTSDPSMMAGLDASGPMGMDMGGMQQGMAGMQGNMQQGMNMMQGNMQQGMGGMQGQVMGMNPNVQSIQFPNLQMNTMPIEQGNIGLIMDVYMEMTVELGRTRKVIREILGMGEGTIIELEKLAGEPVDILVNHKPIAKGEVVVIDENFGVRVTEILSPAERVTDM
ncbi:flagellar motor switch protein FliN [Brucepastera parasyntrophica]|uniref:flagellar motor switch protein FliN n=1 Tax=Brucepastera parasyntrophica TaxID=2880008 RepID=UPI002108CF40|nr:flagellar motor switch protein FliN [Brucepastera parasyntrophica]ULQ59800.1 flagellar motor switch protein FliN [Brucepastera parasyntrophica]